MLTKPDDSWTLKTLIILELHKPGRTRSQPAPRLYPVLIPALPFWSPTFLPTPLPGAPLLPSPYMTPFTLDSYRGRHCTPWRYPLRGPWPRPRTQPLFKKIQKGIETVSISCSLNTGGWSRVWGEEVLGSYGRFQVLADDKQRAWTGDFRKIPRHQSETLAP